METKLNGTEPKVIKNKSKHIIAIIEKAFLHAPNLTRYSGKRFIPVSQYVTMELLKRRSTLQTQ